MKRLTIIFVISFVLQSCSISERLNNKVPEYTDDETKTEQMVTHQPIPLSSDSTKTIVVYNVVEKNEKGLSDETWRSFIAQFFGTISTIFALIYGTQNP